MTDARLDLGKKRDRPVFSSNRGEEDQMADISSFVYLISGN